MAQVLIRNLDEAVVARHKREAERDGVSLEQRLRDIMTRTAGRDDERFERISNCIAAKTVGLGWDPADLIRADRDR
jgi:plasmid stability protein